MRKVCKIENLDCANCAMKIEDGVKRIKGVNDASVNFMTQKMIVDVEDSNFDSILKEVLKVSKKVEPDCEISVK